MLDVVEAAYDNIHENLYTGLVFVDLRKAFNTFCHKILLSKLEHYGIRGATYKLICFYLQDQRQLVSLNQTRSDLGNIQLGVLQRSFLGPLFFLIYINDSVTQLVANPYSLPTIPV